MGFRRIRISAAALAGAAALMFTGVASAAPAGTPTPTADLQLCGTVYDTGPWSEFGPVAGNGVADVMISSPGVPSAITAADGTYCLQGDDTILIGGLVELTAVKLGLTFTTGAGTSLNAHTWGYNTTPTGTQIDLSLFISHLCSNTFSSACHFDFVAS